MNPKLSVIVVCLNPPDVREKCLDVLANQMDSSDTEILVVGRSVKDEQNGGGRSSSIRWLSAPVESTVPQMRTYAILQSRGEIVALLEDDCVVSESWMSDVMKAHAGEDKIIGGAIAAGNYPRLLDWAVYFCEYARFMPPFSGLQSALPGNNVSYKRTALPSLNPTDGFYEVFFHDQWLNSGGRLVANPNMEVTNVNHWSVRHITSIPFHHGRAFAGMRSSQFSLWRKGVYSLLSLALPTLKLYRLAVVVYNRRKYRSQFIFSLPLTAIFLASWSIGEMIGYAAGTGRSAEQWR